MESTVDAYKPFVWWLTLYMSLQSLVALLGGDTDPLLDDWVFYVWHGSLIVGFMSILISSFFVPRLWAILVSRVAAVYLGGVVLAVVASVMTRFGLNPPEGVSLGEIITAYFGVVALSIVLFVHARYVSLEMKRAIIKQKLMEASE